MPVQVLRNKNQADRLVWSLNESSFIPADMKNNDGFLVMGDRRSRTNTWGHHASPIMTVVGSHLYIPTMSGTVYCIDWNVGSLDENAILSINDLGVAGPTWTRSSISFDSGKLYARTIKQLICIGTN
ncbi:MAG: PQQ-binding-like beta-propeller repeat protein [Planctomycetota bacterium]|nr:PQQ-binding-like beta-propeller repeat protein [Planctomycetota bacterium]